MNSLVLLGIGLVVFFLAYVLYGGWLAKKWGVSKENITPAHRLNDNRDFVPTDVKVVMGHHFSSIAGAGPITGPILAAIFGWVPVYLWILIGCTFLGGVHDFGSLVISLRHDGKSIGETIRTNISPRAKKIFNWYAWLTLTLVVAAFTDICAQTFAFNPAAPEALTGARAGTASVLFIRKRARLNDELPASMITRSSGWISSRSLLYPSSSCVILPVKLRLLTYPSPESLQPEYVFLLRSSPIIPGHS